MPRQQTRNIALAVAVQRPTPVFHLGYGFRPQGFTHPVIDSACFSGRGHIFDKITDEIKLIGLGGPIDGVLTEYKVLPAHGLVRIPDGWSYVEASTLPCAAVTAYNALLGANPLKGGDTVLVLGTGGVSIFGLQIAVASGATVIATSSSDNKLEVAKQLGAKHVINYKKTPDWEEEVFRITGGRGVDHVIDVGGAGTINKSLASTRYGGTVSVIGFVGGVGNPLTVA